MEATLDTVFNIKRISPEEAMKIVRHYQISQCHAPRVDYANISNKLRSKLIKRISSGKFNIREIANNFGIKYTTLKSIWDIYVNEGRIRKMRTKPRKRDG